MAVVDEMIRGEKVFGIAPFDDDGSLADIGDVRIDEGIVISPIEKETGAADISERTTVDPNVMRIGDIDAGLAGGFEDDSGEFDVRSFIEGDQARRDGNDGSMSSRRIVGFGWKEV